MASLDDVDLLDHDLFAAREPWDVFERLRHDAPVYWHDEPGGRGFWNVTRYDDVVAVLKDTDTYSSELGGVAQIEDMREDELEARRNFMETDPPRHTQWRRLFARDFAPRSLEQYEPFLRDLTRGLLDETLPLGEFDFVERIASPIPIRVLGHVLGVPEEHLDRLVELGDAMLVDTDPELARVVAGSAEHQRLPPRAVRQSRGSRALRDRARDLRQPPRAPAGRHPLARRPREDRRLPARRARARQHVRDHGRRRQRDHPAGDGARHARADALPRPAGAAALGRGRLALRRRRADPLRLAGLVLPPHRDARRRARGHADPRRRQGRRLVRLGEPRSAALPGPGSARSQRGRATCTPRSGAAGPTSASARTWHGSSSRCSSRSCCRASPRSS